MDREEIVQNWLEHSDWKTWLRSPMTGDASARRYERLTHGERSVILMDAPPETCGSQENFVTIAAHLRGLGLGAPDVYDWDAPLGLMILEDLDGPDFGQHISAYPDDEAQLYQSALTVLRALQSAPPPPDLVQMTPAIGADMIALAFDWAATDHSAELAHTICAEMTALLTSITPDTHVLCLRDFHAENLIWRGNRSDLGQVGLLDFQDAFISHPMYDVASMLRDARRDVSPDMLDLLVTDPTERRAFHILALQRNIRILGIFHRLAKRDGKVRYLDFIPRVWGHIQTDLKAPETRALAPLINRAFAETP